MVCVKLNKGVCNIDKKTCRQSYETKMGIKKCKKLSASKQGLRVRLKKKLSKKSKKPVKRK
ncbi:MAG: hypothetical protein PHW96_00780 [Candidatus Nanoarchaeia archaeon]|nr:hypothetical protein [Candidatus Nanoarchaeia archaeon]